jgi:uncharacterized repeat protein (TIGR01451 family)
MKSSLSRFRRVGLACVALGSIVVAQPALAAGTAATTAINNKATVNYQVGGVAQPFIESSPTGNSTPGLNNGTNTQFVVDRKVDLTIQEVNSAATVVTPGQLNQVTTFFVTNAGNDTQGISLSAANLPNGSTTLFSATPDAFDMTNVRVFVESTPCTGIGQAGLSYVAASDTATNIATIAEDACAFVYVVADTPVTATNGQPADVRLTAIVRAPTTLAALTETAGAESAAVVDVVFADSGRDATATADDQYLVSAASLSVGKTSAVISDPFNGTAGPGVFPKAIPNAVMEYGITLTNTGGQNATVVTITDPIPANTTFANNVYSGNTRNVSITVGAVTTFCQAEAGGTDSNADGCFLTGGGTLTVGAPALASVATGAGNAVTVRFRVTIN